MNSVNSVIKKEKWSCFLTHQYNIKDAWEFRRDVGEAWENKLKTLQVPKSHKTIVWTAALAAPTAVTWMLTATFRTVVVILLWRVCGWNLHEHDTQHYVILLFTVPTSAHRVRAIKLRQSGSHNVARTASVCALSSNTRRCVKTLLIPFVFLKRP